MTSKAPTIRRQHLERFVTEFKEKAVDILLRCCHDDHTISQEIVDVLLAVPPSVSNNSQANNTYAPSALETSPTSQRAGSFSGHRRQPSRSNMRPNARPSTPPKSRSSLSGKDGIETILILSTDDEDIKKDFASMKPAPIKYSVIGKHMFHNGRIPQDSIADIDELTVNVPQRGVPGSLVPVKVRSCAGLTWKSTRTANSTSKATHHTVFYLVPQEFLDIDILLGSRDSGEDHDSDLQEGESFHLSAFSEQEQVQEQHDEILGNLSRIQQGRMSAVSRSTPAEEPIKRSETPVTVRAVTADRNPSSKSGKQPAASGEIRIRCKLDTTTIGIRLDLDAHAGVFIDNVRKEFRRRELEFDQSTTAICLKPDKEMPDKDGRFVSLDEDDLEDDWIDTIHWLRTCKHQNSNIIYGVFKIDDDIG